VKPGNSDELRALRWNEARVSGFHRDPQRRHGCNKVAYRAATYSALSFMRKLAQKGPFI
jgi:hypothetical protein